MNATLFPAMREVVERIVRAPHLLLAVDFDGAITPIVEDPAQAFLSSAMRQVLWSLIGRNSVSVAILSGRTHADLQERVGISGLIYAGNHGLEIHGPEFTFIEPTAAALGPTLKEIAAELTEQLRQIPGTFVEDKRLTLSVHYRRVEALDREKVWRTVFTSLERFKDQFQLATGDMVYEIRPHLRWDKGAAVKWIAQQLQDPQALVVYLGDNRTEESVFASLSDAITIKVGDSAETAAHYLMASSNEVQSFLEWVDQLLREKVEKQ